MRTGVLLRIQTSSTPRLLLVGLLALILVWSALLLRPMEPVPSPYRAWTGEVHPAPPLPPRWYEAMESRASRVVEGIFRRGDTLAGVLARLDVSGQDVDRLARTASAVVDLGRLRPGQSYRVFLEDDALLGLEVRQDLRSIAIVGRHDDRWQATRVTIPYRVRRRYLETRVRNTLVASLGSSLHNSPRLAWELAAKVSQIFAWEVDFASELQPGDRLEMLVEERFIDDQFVGYGDVLYAMLTTRGRPLRAVRYRDAGGTLDYYTPEGESLRRTFLPSPVRYSRISSRFSLGRMHPILGYRRAHRGIDYVAPPGAPVHATADGVVVLAGRGPERGRYVKIRHGGSFATYYLHLSRIAPEIRHGAPVDQGQTIGFVGKTGLARGYHLHYAVAADGRFVDPMEMDAPPAEPVPEEKLEEFRRQVERWQEQFVQARNRARAVVAGGA